MQNGEYLREIHQQVTKNTVTLDNMSENMAKMETRWEKAVDDITTFAKTNRLYGIFAIVLVIFGIAAYAALVYGPFILPRDIGLSALFTLIGSAVGILVKRST